MVSLGICYHDGEGVDKDMRRAVELFEQAAEQGYGTAIFNLGACYFNGKGVDKDPWRGAELFEHAAQKANDTAKFYLALCYGQGVGVDKDMPRAVGLHQQAATKGHAKAMLNVALCYAKGEGVDKDMPRAVALYCQAAEQGHAEALIKIKQNVPTVPHDFQRATAVLKHAAVLGSDVAVSALMEAYGEEGVIAVQDVQKAYVIQKAQWVGNGGNKIVHFRLVRVSELLKHRTNPLPTLYQAHLCGELQGE